MTQNRPGSFMSYLPGAVKDALLLLVTLGMVVVVLLQVEQNNKVSSRQHDMHFVKVIDSEVTPKLESIDPIFVPIPPPC
jgi:hypothetical protein